MSEVCVLKLSLH